MYGSWGVVCDAEKVFGGCSMRDLFTWNLMMGVYVGSGDAKGASRVFDEMPERDVVSWSTVIAGYVQLCVDRLVLGSNAAFSEDAACRCPSK